MICGAERYVIGQDRVCVREAGHEPPHRDDAGVIWEVHLNWIPEKQDDD